jgi:hypothetical protein
VVDDGCAADLQDSSDVLRPTDPLQVTFKLNALLIGA